MINTLAFVLFVPAVALKRNELRSVSMTGRLCVTLLIVAPSSREQHFYIKLKGAGVHRGCAYASVYTTLHL